MVFSILSSGVVLLGKSLANRYITKKLMNFDSATGYNITHIISNGISSSKPSRMLPSGNLAYKIVDTTPSIAGCLKLEERGAIKRLRNAETSDYAISGIRGTDFAARSSKVDFVFPRKLSPVFTSGKYEDNERVLKELGVDMSKFKIPYNFEIRVLCVSDHIYCIKRPDGSVVVSEATGYDKRPDNQRIVSGDIERIIQDKVLESPLSAAVSVFTYVVWVDFFAYYAWELYSGATVLNQAVILMFGTQMAALQRHQLIKD